MKSKLDIVFLREEQGCVYKCFSHVTASVTVVLGLRKTILELDSLVHGPTLLPISHVIDTKYSSSCSAPSLQVH